MKPLLGDALGFPFEVGVARAIEGIALTSAGACRTATGAVLPVYHPQLRQQGNEWDTNTYHQAVNLPHTLKPIDCASSPIS
jgi:hypothetical protein